MALSTITDTGSVILSAATATPQDLKNAALSRFQVLRDKYIKEGQQLQPAEQQAAAAVDKVFGTHLADSIPQAPMPAPTEQASLSTAPPGAPGAEALLPQATAQVASAQTDTPIYDRYVRSQFPTGPTPLHDTYVTGSAYSGTRTPLYNKYVGTGPLSDTASAQAAMQQKPNFPIHFPEEGHEHTGPFAGTVQMAAKMLSDFLNGSSNLLLGPPPPEGVQTTFGIASQKSIESQTGRPFVLTEAQMANNRTAAAFVASSLVGGMASNAILKGLQGTEAALGGLGARATAAAVGSALPKAGFITTALSGTAAGAAFGALRPKDQNESLLGAIMTDALVFGGMSLAGGLVGYMTRPIQMGVDGLEKAGIPVYGGAGTLAREMRMAGTASGVEYGKALYEEVNGIAHSVDGAPPLVHLDDAIQGLGNASIAQVPDNIGFFRRYLGTPSLWRYVGGVVGLAAERLTNNAGQRMGVALREFGAWQAILGEAENLITKDIPAMGGGLTFPAREALIQARKQELGKLLDNVFQPTDLPVTISPNMTQAFTIIRNRLLADREALRLLLGGTADWGIDAYLPHVFVNNWAITDALTKQVYKIVGIGDIRTEAAQILAENPNAALRIVPKDFMIPAELTSLGMTGKQIGIFLSKAQNVLSIDRDEIASMLFENNVVRVKPGKKWFANTLARGEPALEGFETDPFIALRMYATGFTRKIAFHDFEQKAGAIIGDLARTQGTQPSVQALKVYVDRVLGRPSELETSIRETFRSWAKWATTPLGPGVQETAQEFADPRNWLAKVNQFEAFARLGYSPIAWYTNLSQTLVNTSSAIGWGPTLRGIRLFLDKSQRPQVDALLRALDIDLAVPLTQADEIVTRNVGQVSPWHPLYLFNKVETANRAIAGLAKYQEQILKGVDIRTAMDEARNFVRETQFDYSLADAPRLLQGPLGAGVFQFKKFVLKEMEFIWSLRKNPAALARFHANVWAIGGTTALFSIPPYVLLDWATGKLTGETLNERIQAAYPRAARGIPGAAGIDLGGNIAIGLPRETGDVLGPGILDMWTGIKMLADAAVVNGNKLIPTIIAKQGVLTPQERAQAVSGLVPVMVRRFMDSYNMIGQGVVTARGTTQLKYRPEDIAREAVLAAFGFRSLAMAEEQRVSTTIRREVQLHQDNEQAIVQAWATAYVGGDTESASKILYEAQQNGLLISTSQLRDAIAGAILERTTRAMKGAPPELRLEELRRLQQLQGEFPR